jgi:hypothetical protein
VVPHLNNSRCTIQFRPHSRTIALWLLPTSHLHRRHNELKYLALLAPEMILVLHLCSEKSNPFSSSIQVSGETSSNIDSTNSVTAMQNPHQVIYFATFFLIPFWISLFPPSNKKISYWLFYSCNYVLSGNCCNSWGFVQFSS